MEEIGTGVCFVFFISICSIPGWIAGTAITDKPVMATQWAKAQTACEQNGGVSSVASSMSGDVFDVICANKAVFKGIK